MKWSSWRTVPCLHNGHRSLGGAAISSSRITRPPTVCMPFSYAQSTKVFSNLGHRKALRVKSCRFLAAAASRSAWPAFCTVSPAMSSRSRRPSALVLRATHAW